MGELSRYKLRCRRGMKELDVVLERYLVNHFPQANPEELERFNELLELQDPQLFGIIFQTELTPEKFQHLAEKIRSRS